MVSGSHHTVRGSVGPYKCSSIDLSTTADKLLHADESEEEPAVPVRKAVQAAGKKPVAAVAAISAKQESEDDEDDEDEEEDDGKALSFMRSTCRDYSESSSFRINSWVGKSRIG